jgi:uncharacterized RDD family membrane protein YckC
MVGNSAVINDNTANANPQIIGVLLGMYVIMFGTGLLLVLLEVAWEALATHHWGRTPGKAIVGIRPVKVINDNHIDPSRMPMGTCWGRAACYLLIPCVPFVGGILSLLNELWCLWDGERQCLHDKIVHTVVIAD